VERTDVHPKVFVAEMRPVDPQVLQKGLDMLRSLEAGGGEELHPDMVRCFMSIVPNYHPSPTGIGRCLQPQEEPAGATPAKAKVWSTGNTITLAISSPG
jgi:hypothetical protein